MSLLPIARIVRCEKCGFSHEVGPCPEWTTWEDEDYGYYGEDY